MPVLPTWVCVSVLPVSGLSHCLQGACGHATVCQAVHFSHLNVSILVFVLSVCPSCLYAVSSLSVCYSRFWPVGIFTCLAAFRSTLWPALSPLTAVFTQICV